MIKNRNIVASFCTLLTQYLTPYSLRINPCQQIPLLKLKQEKIILKNWWSESPFQATQNLKAPIFNFNSNQFARKSVQLPSEIFNQPLRRDLIYRLYFYRSMLNKFTTKMTRNRAMTAGSGRKERPQKKTGSARMGDKRAPHLKKGGKAHGSKPKVYSIYLNSKIKLKALCSLLTAKLSEGKIRIIQHEKLEEPKTKLLSKIISSHQKDQRAIFCFITSSKIDQNFSYAHRSLKRVICHDPYNLDVKSLFVADKIYITLKGLQQLIQNIQKTRYVIYRQPHMPKLQQNKKQEDIQDVKWDPEKPYEFKFRVLAEYLDLYDKIKKESPELLEGQMKKIRKIQGLNQGK